MLRGLDPLLSPDLLHALRSMGHGDEIVITDANFPSESTARNAIRLDASRAADVLKAVLSVMPLDTYAEDGVAFSMQTVGQPDVVPPIVSEFQAIINAEADNPAEIQSVERHAFYDRASDAFAVIATGEPRPYGNLILKKGVVALGGDDD